MVRVKVGVRVMVRIRMRVRMRVRVGRDSEGKGGDERDATDDRRDAGHIESPSNGQVGHADLQAPVVSEGDGDGDGGVMVTVRVRVRVGVTVRVKVGVTVMFLKNYSHLSRLHLYQQLFTL